MKKCLPLLLLLPACVSNLDGNTASSAPYVVVPAELQEGYDNFQFAQAMRAGDMLYLSGVVVTLADDETRADMAPAINRAFDEIELILTEGGADWSNVVDVTSYMTDLDQQIGPMWEIKSERLSTPPYPAWTVIGTPRLFGGDAALIEIKVTAYLPQ